LSRRFLPRGGTTGSRWRSLRYGAARVQTQNQTVGLGCLRDVAAAFLATRAATLDGAALQASLQRLLQPALALARKTPSGGTAPEHLAVLRTLCTACMPLAPVFVVRRLLTELIMSEGLETALAGLCAAMDVMQQSTARLLQTSAPAVRHAQAGQVDDHLQLTLHRRTCRHVTPSQQLPVPW
jgi:hypothetical protein